MKTISNIANIAGFAVLFVMLAVLLHDPPHVDWTARKVIGAVIAGISFALFVMARVQLGSSFSVRPRARKLVTKGIYSRFRNPVYLFSGTFLAGLSLLASWWGPLFVAAVLVPLQWYRAGRESQVLERAFGDEYRRYRQKTWF
jgi:protein-S-isoprenylcysteine O-methyltransferase Ste14